jgi:hypothetical protein
MLRIDSVDGNCDALFMAKMRRVKTSSKNGYIQFFLTFFLVKLALIIPKKDENGT